MASLDDGDRGEEDYQEFAPPPPSARFAAAVQAAVAAAGIDAQRDEPGCASSINISKCNLIYAVAACQGSRISLWASLQ